MVDAWLAKIGGGNASSWIIASQLIVRAST